MSKHKLITIDEEGFVTALYADDLPNLGEMTVVRASHVEPAPAKLKIQPAPWLVRLSKSKVNGKRAGQYLSRVMYLKGGVCRSAKDARWFLTRAEALQAEVSFIQRFIMEAE